MGWKVGSNGVIRVGRYGVEGERDSGFMPYC